MKTVNAHYFEGWSMSLFGSPKFTIICGECMCSWRQRIPMVNHPHVPCPACGTLNIINVVVGR